jgi:phosphoglycolate phosphatase-like HAD superfamily hydrolase
VYCLSVRLSSLLHLHFDVPVPQPFLTLCYCRYLTEEEYLNWSVTYDAAASAVRDRDDALDRANELIEHSLLILGATALEDKLQEGVPDAIEQLHRAGIKLWILTGELSLLSRHLQRFVP